MGGLKRMVGGGGLFLTRYDGPGSITFAAKVPGHIVPVDISRRALLPGAPARLDVRHAWHHAERRRCSRASAAGLYGGEGFVLQKLDGEGRAWVELGGEVTSYDLPPGQTVLVHPGHIGMFQGTRAVLDHQDPAASRT